MKKSHSSFLNTLLGGLFRREDMGLHKDTAVENEKKEIYAEHILKGQLEKI